MKTALQKLFAIEKAPPLLFLVVIYIVGAATEGFADTLQYWLEPWQILGLGTIILILFVVVINPMQKFADYMVRKRGEILISDVGSAPERSKGLIVLGSQGEPMPAETAILYHYKGINNEHKEPVLEKCWLITSGDISLKAVRNLIAKLVKDGFPVNLFEIVEMSADYADNPAKVYNVVEEIFQSLPEGFDEQDIIADYTGGTKSTTAGLVLACARPARRLQVLKPRKYKEDGTAVREAGSDPMPIDIRFKLKQVNKQ